MVIKLEPIESPKLPRSRGLATGAGAKHSSRINHRDALLYSGLEWPSVYHIYIINFTILPCLILAREVQMRYGAPKSGMR